MTNNKNHFILLLFLTASVLFQVFMPIFGDEAYFVSWGQRFAWGYYDHPPSIGWLSIPLVSLENMLGISPNGILHRIAMLVIAVVMLAMLKRQLSERFVGLDTVTLLTGLAILPVFIVVFNSFFNDTILAVFLLVFFLASEASFRQRHFSWRPVLLAGVAFGLALQTKYSVGVFYLGLVGYLLIFREGRQFLFGRFIVISIIAGLLFLPNIYWNMQNCAVNFAFNFSFRDVSGSPMGAVELILVMLLVAGPMLFFLGYAIFRTPGRIGFFTGALLGVLMVSLIYAVSRGTFRLNWGTPFLLMGVMATAEMLDNAQIKRLRSWNTGYFLVAMLPILAILALDAKGMRPLERFLPPKDVKQFNLEADLADGSLPQALRQISQGRVPATDLYMQTAVLENFGFDDATVLGGSIFGRNHDIFTDYRLLDGRDFLILSQDPDRMIDAAHGYFRTVEVLMLQGNRQTHRVILGQGFVFDAYREQVILPFWQNKYAKSPFPYQSCYLDSYLD